MEPGHNDPGSRHAICFVELGNAAVNLADYMFRERSEVHVERHQHYDVTQSTWIGLGHLNERHPKRLTSFRQGSNDAVYALYGAKPPADVAVQPLSKQLATQEKELIEAALAASQGRVAGPSGAAAKLGIPQSTLDSKIKTLKIDKYQFRKS